MTLSISDIFDHNETAHHRIPAIGSGIISDLEAWSAYYKQNLITTAKSKTTIANYTVALNAFREFVNRYHSNLSGINMILDHINDFLEWIEDYQISKTHGSIRERINCLLQFISESGDVDFENYKAKAIAYLCELDDQVIGTAEYIIFDYYAFLSRSNNKSICKETIRDYIEKRKRVSNATMGQRRIALIAFLKFIDEHFEEPMFSQHFKKIKQYPIAKDVHKVHKGLEDDESKKVDEYLMDLADTFSRLDRKLYWREYCHLRTATMIALMKWAGLRTSEAIALKFSDIEEPKNGKTYRLNIIGKGNKKGRVSIRIDIFAPLLALMIKNKKGEYLSSGHSGEPMGRSNLYVSVKTLFGKIGINRKGLHLLRHTFGSNFVTKNGNIKVLQQILRHVNISTTMLYSNVNDNAMAEAVAGL